MSRTFHSVWVFVVLVAGATGCGLSERQKPDADSNASAHDREMITLPRGTRLDVSFDGAFDTDRTLPGDEVTGVLTAPVFVDGDPVLDAGTLVRGRVASVDYSRGNENRKSLRVGLMAITAEEGSIPVLTRTNLIVIPMHVLAGYARGYKAAPDPETDMKLTFFLLRPAAMITYKAEN